MELIHVGHDFCSHLQQAGAVSRNIQIAFDDEGMWDDAGHGVPTESVFDPDARSTLGELLVPRSGGLSISTFEACEFEPEDHMIVEVLLACSLFHLNTSHWLRGGWDVDNILMLASPRAQNPLKRWRPHITCSLELPPGSRGDDSDYILSFGLLIMEMEAKRKASPTDEDKDWLTGLPSKDSMLKRVLKDWKRKLEDDYQKIGTACLLFRELAEKFYHPALEEDMKRTAAIYRYILVPLYQLITRRYRSASLLFNDFPRPPESSSAPYLRPSQPRWGSPLILFDDSKSDSNWHNPE
jgi:hypothetical protein